MTDPERIHFRNELREARAAALRDAEQFSEILFVVERLGSFLTGKMQALGDYTRAIGDLASKSPLFRLPKELHGWNPPFNRLYQQLTLARNDALHQGAFARHLTVHAIHVSLILEDALMDGSDKIGDFMVTNVVCACLWQPLSFVRQQMLQHSFTFLPVTSDDGEPTNQLVSDCSIARYLAGYRKERLAHSLGDGVNSGEIELLETTTWSPSDKVSKILNDENVKERRLPVLIVEEIAGKARLTGIVTAFDLL
jgi:hypothetical protein